MARLFGLLIAVTFAWRLGACSLVSDLEDLKAHSGGDASVSPDGGKADGGKTDGGACTAKTCSALSAQCGEALDGCGAKLDCGECPGGLFCGGGGPNRCGQTPCIAKTCQELSAECGQVSDGCGKVLDCGGCTLPQKCGGTGTANVCGCTPLTCDSVKATCGQISDGCGGTLTCGTCQPPQSCGGGGPANQCGCKPKSCAELGASCGKVPDGCGGLADCGNCASGEICGGAGPNKCGTAPCQPKSCADQRHGAAPALRNAHPLRSSPMRAAVRGSARPFSSAAKSSRGLWASSQPSDSAVSAKVLGKTSSPP